MHNISFIILCPMLGYKKHNKKYLKLELAQKNVDKIYRNFKNPDIILVTGIYTPDYEKIKNSKFRICQNQLESTGEIEQIRLGVNNSINSKFLIFKEDCDFNIRTIKRGIKEKENFVLLGNKEKNPGVIVNKNKVENISFGLYDIFFNDLLFLNSLNIETTNFLKDKLNQNKTFHELANFLIEKKPIKYYEDTNK